MKFIMFNYYLVYQYYNFNYSLYLMKLHNIILFFNYKFSYHHILLQNKVNIYYMKYLEKLTLKHI